MKITVVGCGRWGSLITWYLAEGYYTVKAMIELGKTCGVDLPICRCVYEIVHEGVDAKIAIGQLFERSIKTEFYV